MFVQPRGEPRGGRRAGWSGSTAVGTGGAGGMPGGRAHRPRPVQPWVRWGVSRAGPVWPGARDPRLEARPAGGRRGAPRQARPRARSPGRREIRAQTCGLHVSRGRTHGRGMGEARQAPLPLGRKRGRPPAFPRVRVRGFRVAGPPAPLAWRAASSSLGGSPPPRRTAVGRKLDALGGAAVVGAAGRGRRAAGRLRVPPARRERRGMF